MNPEFIYTTYIKTTPEKLWQALTNPEFTRRYWNGDNVSDWKAGSNWQHLDSDDHEVLVTGKVLESEAPRRLVLTWAHASTLDDECQVTFEIEAMGDMVQLTVIHDHFKAGSPMQGLVSKGWPRVLSSLKTMLETGTPLNTWVGHTSCARAEKAAIAN